MSEADDNFTVGFDPAATSALSAVTIPARPDRGHAGADGRRRPDVRRRRRQRHRRRAIRPALKWSPRVGAVYSLTPTTVLRAGYGVYWAPWNYPAPSSASSNYGQLGFTQNTVVPQTAATPTVSLTNPFPNGLVAPLGSSLGALTGAGTSISYVDQNRGAPRVQQYSVDLQKELASRMAVTVSYIGARGDDLPLGGTVDTALNVNQLDPKYMALGSASERLAAEPVLRQSRPPARWPTRRR